VRRVFLPTGQAGLEVFLTQRVSACLPARQAYRMFETLNFGNINMHTFVFVFLLNKNISPVYMNDQFKKVVTSSI